MSDEIRPFRVDIPSSEQERLHRKLLDTRVPEKSIVPGAGADYGFTTAWATDMYNYWKDQFSWEKQQTEINIWPHFLTDINGQTIHFIHATSWYKQAIPILLIHGWPGSFYEFSQVIDLLRNPREGGHAFHVVVPSLPGFCFSSGPPRGQTLSEVGGMFHKLMLRLGYEKFAVQAGDWGQWVAREIGSNPAYRKSVIAMHFNWCPAPLPEKLSPREEQVATRVQAWLTKHLGYAILMRTRPHTVGWMLQDNPVGLLAFVGEKYDELSNPDNPLVQSDKWKDHILTTVCLYYFTNCIMTGCLPYFENMYHEDFPKEIVKPERRIRCPMAYTSYLFDSRPSSKAAVAKTGNLVYYNERDNAGHFACLEDPKGVVEDVRALTQLVAEGGAKHEDDQ